MAHLTQNIPLPQLSEVKKFIEEIKLLALSCRRGSLSITPVDSLVTVVYIFGENGSCGCTVRKQGNDLDCSFFWKNNNAFDLKYKVTLEEAERILKRIIANHEAKPDQTYETLKKLMTEQPTQPTTAAESISDIKRKLERLM
jgi:hypothetical protein